ncbi:hypothetical protein [Umezawaea tangerina]|uniref:Histidine kinase-like protein n=1 Tax=Umezawaea tangerina TaxID=84725 RepID=A0A2T0SQH7_9PSEU|nr:hypothetical protein [Umezawaea tangerina]PRY35667.1 hypothetical protein CLV43_11394 [Umezawaea tangerina]
MPESLDVALYRIVQEMLTNALRHGDLSGVDVELSFTGDTLALTTSNPVPAATPDRPAGWRASAAVPGCSTA